ncbi:MAG: DUF1775 domain-containing protein [Labilithrix sp.]|nr:DUF1775 domain-containing protein [Labilithrix sp.]
MRTKTKIFAIAALGTLLGTVVAHAHVGVASGPATANVTQEVTFSVGHGCLGSTVDTYRVRVEIPAGVTNVRALTSDFGKPTLEKDGGGVVTAVVWQKSVDDLVEGDTNYYKLTMRVRPPNAPFTKISFPVYQTCRDLAGVESTNDWVGTPTLPDGGLTSPDPAPVVTVMPARVPGWNKYPIPVAIKDLSIFNDALIVWKGSAAYSKNPNTAAQITSEPGVTALTELAAGDEIWVKY